MNLRLGLLAGLVAVLAFVSVILLGIGIHDKLNRKSVSCSRDSEVFQAFMHKVQAAYYKNKPNYFIYKPDSQVYDIRSKFKPYDCSPESIKRTTDESLKLYIEIEKLKINEDKLNTRERRAYAQVKHYLKTIFGTPFDQNYYIGDWMLGPNNFCWQAICDIGTDFKAHYNAKTGFQPKTVADVEHLLLIIKLYERTINQYVKNMKLGVKAGMVRAQEQCKAGIDAIKVRFPEITEKKEKGILDESFVAEVRKPSYLSKLSQDAKKAWKVKTGKMVSETIDEYLIQFIGKPMTAFLKYLVEDHYTHCTPSTSHSGLSSLPLDYVWTNGSEDKSKPTIKTLPTGEKLNGKKAYEAILPYFTTIDMSPDEIYALGKRQVDILYPRAMAIAKSLTNQSDDAQAAQEFKNSFLLHPNSFFNSTPIPSNETGDEAHRKCKDMKTAKLYCPVRHKAMLDWFDYVQTILARLDPKTVNFFYFTGNKSTTPNCPVRIRGKFNPSSGSQSYRSAGASCKRPCYYMLPFWLTPPGPKYNAISVAGHEGRPGHHTQVQGFHEHFSGGGGTNNDPISWLNGITYYTAFTEGWALYSENPLLAQGTDIYKNDQLQEYGMLKWQIWRALRLMIDTGLHYKGMKRHEALALFEKYAWDNSDKAIKDVTRYQSSPGQATAYMIGQLAIWRIRNETISKLKAKNIMFSEKEFHYYLLSQGSAPLSYLESFMKKYTSCKIDNTQSMCASVMNPIGNPKGNSNSDVIGNRPIQPQPFHEHYD